MTTKITEQNISNLANIGVQWQSVFTGDGSTGLTAVAGRGYFIDTTSGTVTVTLPASPSAGDVVVLKDYARTWNTNNLTIASSLFDGQTSSQSFSTNGQTITLVYIDGTKGWSLINEDTTSALIPPAYVAATGGTVTESGNYKIHTFTGDGCFVVSCGGNAAGSDSVDYLVVAGGGGGGGGNHSSGYGRGGGGAGGFREGYNPGSYCASPLATSALPVCATTYPVTVGGGGSGIAAPASCTTATAGSNSVFSTITSAGGGGGGTLDGGSGGSGGGAGDKDNADQTGGTGNTPPVSPSQGNPGGDNYPDRAGGGGGGATAVGGNPFSPHRGGAGGAGATTSISASTTTYAGGGGGGGNNTPCNLGGPGGSGGGGNGGGYLNPCGRASTAGSANTGGGGGAGGYAGANSNASGSAGGKGIVIIRYKFQ